MLWSFTKEPLISQLLYHGVCPAKVSRDWVSAKSFQVMKGQKSPCRHFYSVKSHRSMILSAFRHLFFDGVWRFTFFLNYCPRPLSLTQPCLILLIISQNYFQLSLQRRGLNLLHSAVGFKCGWRDQ